MSENANENTAKSKKYFWYRLMDSFFDRTDIKLILKLQGTDYVVLYQKMMCRCLRNDGYLSMNGLPLDNKSLSVILDEDEEKVNKAIEVFKSYNLLEKENDFYYLPEFETLTGSESEYAEKKRDYRAKNKANGQSQDNSKTMSDTKSDIVRDRDIERDKDISEIEAESNNNDDVQPPHNDIDNILSEYIISKPTADKLVEWIEYLAEKKQPLSPSSVRALCERTEEYERRFKSSEIINLIRDCMSAGYKDIYFDRLDNQEKRENLFDKWLGFVDNECVDDLYDDSKTEEVTEPIQEIKPIKNSVDVLIDQFRFDDEINALLKKWASIKGGLSKQELKDFAHWDSMLGGCSIKVLERCISDELKEVDFQKLFGEVC